MAKIEYESKDKIIHLHKVELGYGEGVNYSPVLTNINIEEFDIVREGSITGQTVAIVGRSGRGKSTLFRAIAGLVSPKSGSVFVTDLDTPDATDAKIVKEGDIGYVDQKYTLYRHMTVKNILMAAQWKSTRSKAEKKVQVDKYLKEWGLYKQKDQYPCDLSGGQRQRTAIIEQMLCSGHFMLLDEPFSGLDVGNIASCKETFRLYYEAHELNTIIFSTHDMKLAVEIADSIYVVGYTPEKMRAEELRTFMEAKRANLGNKVSTDPDWAKANLELDQIITAPGYVDCSTLVKHYDLKALGLAWREFETDHLEFLNELTQTVKNS